MKTKIVLLAAAILLNHSASAQTTSTTTTVTTSPASAETANQNVSSAVSSIPAQTSGVRVGVKYLGIIRGPGLEFSGLHTPSNTGSTPGTPADYGDLSFDNRPRLFAKVNPNLDVGVEARFNTFFGNGNSLRATAGASRIFANIKNLIKTDVYNLTLIPRIVLPVTTAFRGQKGTLSPELIASFDISPKNSRFSLGTGLQYIHFLHTAGATGKAYTDATTAALAGWIEVDYQLTPNTQVLLSYWPSMSAEARKGTPLHNDGNEVDFGAYIQVAKGWQVAPYLATEMTNVDLAHLERNMAVNVLLIGTVL